MRRWATVAAVAMMGVSAASASAAPLVPATFWISHALDATTAPVAGRGSASDVYLAPTNEFLAYSTKDPAITGNGKVTAMQVVVDEPNTGRNTIISTPTGAQAPPITSGASSDALVAGVSGDGSRVLYLADAAAGVGTVPTGTTGVQAFLWDRDTNTTRMVSAPEGLAPDGFVLDGALSDDGNRAALSTTAENVDRYTTELGGVSDAGDPQQVDVYVYDWDSGQLMRASGAAGGGLEDITDDSYGPAISRDGRYVAYTARAKNGARRFVVRVDLTDRTRVLGGAGEDGAAPNDLSDHASISGDGTRIGFTTPATNLATGTSLNEAYVSDLTTHHVTRVRVGNTTVPVEGVPQINDDGNAVAFQVGHAPGTDDTTATYTRDLTSTTVERADVPEVTSGTPPGANGPSVVGHIGMSDEDGVLFASEATNLAPYAVADTGTDADVFLKAKLSDAVANLDPPTITDNSAAAQPNLRCNLGSWENGPEHFDYQWLSRPVGTTQTPAPIAGETKAVHLLTTPDQRQDLFCRVTARNAVGPVVVTTDPVAVNFLAPQNDVPPKVTGDLHEGMTLTCDRGTWHAPNGATIVFSQRWTRDSQPIAGATGLTYVITHADLDRDLRCSVTAADAAGSATLDAPPVVPAAGPPAFDAGDPVSGRAAGTPHIQGGPVYGADVSCASTALATPRVLKTTYQWLVDGKPIAGQTGAQLHIAADVGAPPELDGRLLTCRVTLSNGVGDTTLESPPLHVVRGAPVNTARPTVTAVPGATPIDRVLTCGRGTWSDDFETTTEYSWVREGTPIDGATASTYKVTTSDLGHSLQCEVRLVNAAGPATARSDESRVPLPAADASTTVLQHLGTNQYDPSNFMAVSQREQKAYDAATLAFYTRQVDAYRSGCATTPASPADPKRAPTCALLLGLDDSRLTITVGAVFVDQQTLGPCASTKVPTCARLPIDFPALSADQLPADLAAQADGAKPLAYLWDLDDDGHVDATCPANAPVARLLYRGGDWKMKVAVIDNDSAATGILPTAEFSVHIDGTLKRTTRAGATPRQLRSLEGTSGRTRLLRAAAILPPGSTYLANAIGPQGVTGFFQHLQPNQPIACKTSLTPPPAKADLPCLTHGQVGRISLDGNLCPVSLRKLPQAEIAALPADVRKVLDQQALRDEADAVNGDSERRWAPWQRATAISGFFTDAKPTVALSQYFDDFTTAKPGSFTLSATALGSLKRERSALSPRAAAFAMDQIYVAKPPAKAVAGKPEGYGALKVNGVSVEPKNGSAAIIIPSNAQQAVVDTSKAGLEQAASDLGLPTSGAAIDEIKGKAKDAQKALEDMTVSASESVQGLVDGKIPIPLSKEKAEKYVADGIQDATNAAKDQVLAELDKFAKNLPLGPFSATGTFKATLGPNNTVTLQTKAKFPDIFRDESGQVPTFDVTLKGTPEGTFTLEDLKIDVPGTLNIVVLQVVEAHFHYNGKQQLLELNGKLRLLPPAGPTIAINKFVLRNGQLEALDIDYLGPPGIPIFPGVFITKIGGGYSDDGKTAYVRGDAEVSVGPGTNGCSALGLSGAFRADYLPKTNIHIEAGLQVICIPLVNVDVDVNSEGHVGMAVGVDYRLGPAYLRGSIRGDINPPPNLFDPSGLRWQLMANVEGGIEVPLVGSITADIKAVASDSGLGACGEVDLLVTSLSGGLGLRFPHPNAYPTSISAIVDNFDTFSGCDISAYSTGARTRLASNGTDRVTRVPQTGRFAMIDVEGSGGAPAATLVDPSGRVVADGTQGEGKLARTGSAIRIQKESKTVFIVPAKRGDWTIRPAAGSVPIFNVTTAAVLPKPKVNARVSGHGARRKLSYDVQRLPGQVVRFVEHVNGGGQNLARVVKGGGRGHLRFAVADSTGSKRTIRAEVTQDGMPRDVIDVAHFVQAPPKASPPRKVRVRRSGTTVRVRWRKGARAHSTVLALRLPGGTVRTATVYGTQKQRARFAGVSRRAAGKLTLRTVSDLRKITRAVTVKLKGPKQKHRVHKRKRHHRRHKRHH